MPWTAAAQGQRWRCSLHLRSTPPLSCCPLRPTRARPVVQINASLRFEPPRINIFHKDCKRSGRDATCLAAFLCFTPVFLAPYFQTADVGEPGPPGWLLRVPRMGSQAQLPPGAPLPHSHTGGQKGWVPGCQ